MAKMPILSQGDIGNCYAATAAQMIDAYRFSHGDKNTNLHTSPIALAIRAKNYQETVFELNIEAKTKVGLSLQDADSITGALDPARFLRTDINTEYLDGGHLSDVFIQSERENGEIRVCDKKTVEGILNDQQDLRNILQMWNDSKNNMSQYAQSIQLCAFRSHDYVQTMKAIQGSTVKTNLPTFLQTLVDTACAKTSLNTKIPKLASLSFMQLHTVLNRENPQPVAVSYCANFMREHLKNKKCAGHASVIVGRRKTAEGKCEILIRNSWGESCKRYPKPENCENGQYWVDEDTLRGAAFNTQALLDPKEAEEVNKVDTMPSADDVISGRYKTDDRFNP
jgi:hypothetical protein